MIREVGESIGRAILDGIGRATSRIQERKPLPADLLENDDAYLAVFDAPGATASDVQVRLQGGTLSVTVDRFREFHDDYEMRFPGRGLALGGEVELPEGADVTADQADATLTDDGTLEVLVPKTGHEHSIATDARDGWRESNDALTDEDGSTGPTDVDPDDASTESEGPSRPEPPESPHPENAESTSPDEGSAAP